MRPSQAFDAMHGGRSRAPRRRLPVQVGASVELIDEHVVLEAAAARLEELAAKVGGRISQQDAGDALLHARRLRALAGGKR